MAGTTKTNWFAIWVSVAVVIVVAVVSFVAVSLNNSVTDPPVVPESAEIDAETGAILIGDGAHTVATYIDFMCPICNQFEQLYGQTLDAAVNDGSATLAIHPIAILDSRSQGTEFSTRAANAMYCVAGADANKALPFLRAMFQHQPAEGTVGLSDAQILEIAASVGATGLDACVNEGTYSSFVTAMTPKTPVAPGGRGIETPTVAVDGEAISLTGDPAADITARLQ